jgi:hypothetical protein
MDKYLSLPNEVPISLGYCCYTTLFISELTKQDNKTYNRYVFDWLGLPMWSICKLIEDDFVDLNNSQYLVYKKHYSNKNESYVTNTKYNAIFAHDYNRYLNEIPAEQFAHVKAKYDTRIQRFRDILTSGKPIVFFRVERDEPGLINFPEDNITESELFYVKKFAQAMSAKGVNCKIVFFTSSNPTGWDATNKICSVHFEHNAPQTVLLEKDIITIFADNREFIKTSLV